MHLGDAAHDRGMLKAGHLANQEGKICDDAIVRLFVDGQPDPQPVANSTCFSPITSSTASWLTAMNQFDPSDRMMKVTSSGGKTIVNDAPATATEAAAVDSDNFKDIGTCLKTLMGYTTARAAKPHSLTSSATTPCPSARAR